MADTDQMRVTALEQELAAARAEIETLRQRLTETTENTEALYELLHQAPIPISIMHGPEHIVSFSNEANCQVIGVESTQMIGLSVREAFADRGYEPLFALLDQVYTTGVPFQGESPPAPFDRNGNGTLVPTVFNTLYYPSRNTEGHITGVMCVATDVTDQVAQSLIQAAQAVNLLGAQVMLTGIQPQIAQTLVHLGIDLSGFITRGRLQAGIATAIRGTSAST